MQVSAYVAGVEAETVWLLSEMSLSSTVKPLESLCAKDDVFVTTFYTARNYTDQFANLNFIINMKTIEDKDISESSQTVSASTPAT
jgi:hypothetical protein